MRSTGKYFALAAAGMVVFGLGYFLGERKAPNPPPAGQTAQADSQRAIAFWTCSMHPQIKQDGPGRCPICSMELIPVYQEESQKTVGAAEIRLSAAARKRAEIEVTPVERKYVTAEVRMAGKTAFDETRLAYITAWVSGRIDRQYADYTGIPVQKGDHMAELYSPELLTAQQELIQALKTVEKTQESQLAGIRETAQQTVEAVRQKLRRWGLTDEQVREIEKRGQPTDHITIYAPIGGVVIEKLMREGDYVETGNRIYTVADLSRVWVKLEAYESDLAMIRYGQEVEFETAGFPGEVFHGKVAFIDPVIDSRTRTTRVRVNVDNRDGRLKPEMLVRGVVRVQITAEGGAVGPELAGKWICPMHPEIVKEAAGACDMCGMALVTAETLGYAGADSAEEGAPLVIPATAALLTGKQAIVYVAAVDREGVYEGREVRLGPRAGDYYIVKGGLEEGEQVVTRGNFKIDAALQIQAKRSMMNPQE